MRARHLLFVIAIAIGLYFFLEVMLSVVALFIVAIFFQASPFPNLSDFILFHLHTTLYLGFSALFLLFAY